MTNRNVFHANDLWSIGGLGSRALGALARPSAIAAAFVLSVVAPALAQGGESAPPASGPIGLSISQRANGLPGSELGETVPQNLLVGAGSIRLEDTRAGGRFTIVRLAEEVLREYDPKLKAYTEKPFSQLRQQRLKAEAEREDFRKLLLERFEDGRITESELDGALKERGLQRDGSRRLTVSEGAERVRRWATRSYQIAVNGKVYITVFVTADIAGFERPPELYQFYDRVGLFPDDVTAALRKIDGFPVRITAELDYFAAGATIVSEVEEVQAWPVEPRLFETPQGYERVDRFPEHGVAEGEVCAVCGEVIEGRPRRSPLSMSPTTYLCSDACVDKFNRDPDRYER